MFSKQQRLQGGPDLFWGRASLDGAPFRGSAPSFTTAEFESQTERVWDSKFGVFNTSQPDQAIMGRTLQEVMDGCLSGLYRILHRAHQWSEDEDSKQPIMFQYIEWAEPYIEASAGISGGNLNGHGTASYPAGPPPLLR